MKRIYTDVDCLRWSMDVARALVYLHSGIAGSMILHRDINPDNIMLTSQDPHRSAAKLVDFGLHTSIAKAEDCAPDGKRGCAASAAAAAAVVNDDDDDDDDASELLKTENSDQQ